MGFAQLGLGTLKIESLLESTPDQVMLQYPSQAAVRDCGIRVQFNCLPRLFPGSLP